MKQSRDAIITQIIIKNNLLLLINISNILIAVSTYEIRYIQITIFVLTFKTLYYIFAIKIIFYLIKRHKYYQTKTFLLTFLFL